jgi:dTDP-4-amino-4,6-dideoxygalactose transaminase
MNLPKRMSPRVTSVPLLDLGAQYAPLRTQIEAAIRDVCESQHVIMGPQVLRLEERIAHYSNAAFGIGVSSGTDALLVALMALDIGAGDEVITTTYSFFATGGVIARLGARPVFCDVEPESYNIDTHAVARYLESCRRDGDRLINAQNGTTVKAIMPVHLFGRVANMQAIIAIADEYGLSVVEDAAQAIGSEAPDGERAGSIGDIGCFSFFPSKNLGAFGDAGMCVTQDPALAERLRTLRLHGANPKYHHSFVGGNFRLDALQAAILNVKLDHLDNWTTARQANARRYSDILGSLDLPIRFPTAEPAGRHIFNQYVIEVEARDKLQAHLKSRNIGSEVYYPVPLHLQKCFENLGYRRGDCPVSEAAASRTLALPVYPELSGEQQDYVIDGISEFFRGTSH